MEPSGTIVGVLIRVDPERCSSAAAALDALPGVRQRGHDPRHAVLAAVLCFALVAGLPAFGVLSPIHMLGRSAAFEWDPWLLVVALLAAVELVFPGVWCRALCPLGALYSLVGQRAALRIRIQSRHECRSGCGACSVSCPMAVPVMQRYAAAGQRSVTDAAYTRCGACVDGCPRGLLKLGFRRRRTSTSAAQTGG